MAKADSSDSALQVYRLYKEWPVAYSQRSRGVSYEHEIRYNYQIYYSYMCACMGACVSGLVSHCVDVSILLSKFVYKLPLYIIFIL